MRWRMCGRLKHGEGRCGPLHKPRNVRTPLRCARCCCMALDAWGCGK